MSGLEAALEPVFAWLAANPAWAGAFIGLIAFAESLALVGLLVPGAFLMFLAGAAVGGSNIDILPMLAWAVVGAVAGDSLSYWLGRHFRDQLRGFPVVRRYPGALARAESLFHRHGGKSVVIGRFVGPVRPVIPAVVGMLGMPPGRFLLANVSSALAWAPAYLLPGVVFGASLVLAMEVMGRLMAWLVLGFGGFFLLRWLIPRIDRPLRLAGNRLARAVGRHPPPGQWGQWLRPLHAALRALRHRQGWLWWLAFVAFLGTLTEALWTPGPQGWERGLLALAEAQRGDLLRRTAWVMTQAGGLLPVSLATVALAAALWRADERRRARFAVFGVVSAVLVAYALKGLLGTPRPNGLTATAEFAAAFPSAHAAGIAALVTVWVTVLPPRVRLLRWLTLLAGALVMTLVALTRLLLGVHWPLDIVGGLALGITLGALPGVVGGARQAGRHRGMSVVLSAGVLLAATGVTQMLDWPDPINAYPEPADRSVPIRSLDDPLATHRLGLGGPAEGFVAQWQGGEQVPAGFEPDWQPAPPWRWQTLLRWISPRPSAARLPVLPRWHDGRRPDAVLIRVGEDPRRRWVLRAWRGAVTPDGPIWLLSLERDVIRPGVLLPRLRRHAPGPEALAALLGPASQRAGLVRLPGPVPRYRSSSDAAAASPQGGTSP
ncbi:VTT domain-containing protein [Spiribacter onubensis]|uniref:VTT domain-containing protein n=1 Tax=Spiribacter onubensis TaxID=3122420 RepID=A0ABV3SC15_9GAMM